MRRNVALTLALISFLAPAAAQPAAAVGQARTTVSAPGAAGTEADSSRAPGWLCRIFRLACPD